MRDIEITGEGVLTALTIIAIAAVVIVWGLALERDAAAFYQACVQSGGQLVTKEVCLP